MSSLKRLSLFTSSSCLRTPGRVETLVLTEFGDEVVNLPLFLPYVRCSCENTMNAYMEAKYLQCGQKEREQSFDEITEYLTDGELCAQWRENGGGFVSCYHRGMCWCCMTHLKEVTR